MPANLHELLEFIGVKLFFLKRRIPPHKYCIIFLEEPTVHFLDPFDQDSRLAFPDQAPSNQILPRKEPLLFLLHLSPRLIAYRNFRSFNPYIVQFKRSCHIDHVHSVHLQDFSCKHGSHRFRLRPFSQLVQIGIYVVFYIYLRLVADIPYLFHIFRKFTFHILSPHFYLFPCI